MDAKQEQLNDIRNRFYFDGFPIGSPVNPQHALHQIFFARTGPLFVPRGGSEKSFRPFRAMTVKSTT
jgi:hypothetical protein